MSYRRRRSHGTDQSEHGIEASDHVVPERLAGERPADNPQEELELEFGLARAYEHERAQVGEHERALGQHGRALRRRRCPL